MARRDTSQDEFTEKLPSHGRRRSLDSPAVSETHEPDDDGGSSLGGRRHGHGDDDGDGDDAIERIPTRRSAATLRATSGEMKRTASNVLAQVASHMTTRDWAEPPPPPDGGLKAWTQVAMGWLTVCTTWGYVNSFSSFQAYYSGELLASTPPSTISWIGSVQTCLTLLIGAFSGRLLDAGLFLPTFLVGAVLQVLGMFLMSISSEYWQLMLTQGVLTGVGGGIFFTPSLALVTTYFNRRRGLAVGLMTTGNSAGGIIYPIVVRELIPRLGFPWTARVLAFINTAFLALVLAFMRPRLPPRQSGPVLDLAAFKDPVYSLFCASMFGLMWSNYFTYYYIASFATDILGLTYSAASLLIIVLNAVGMPFRVLFPYLADVIGPVNVAAPLGFMWVVAAFCWLSVGTVPGYYVFTVFYGIAAGSFQSLIATIAASITPRLDMTGTRLGMAFSLVAFASLTGPPIGGALQQSLGGAYTAAQAWAAASTTVGFLLMCTMRVLKTVWVLRKRA